MALTFHMDQKDTIAAIATAISEAGIGIIRISGPDAVSICEKIYRRPKDVKDGRLLVSESGYQSSVSSWKTHTLHLGYIIDPVGGEVIDEVMCSIMRAPHSYTAEDVIEINSHGGVYLLHRILDVVLSCGARMAEPGEFTKRAFLNGRVDLTRAEAVMDLIASQNEFARKTSLSQLSGALFDEIKSMREKILYEIAFIESALDDPDNYSTEGYPEHLREICIDLLSEMDHLLAHADDGHILKEGIRTVILGRPNAGKSSLLNVLAGEERAIVTEVAGTTRDTLNESIRLSGIPLLVTDTAGIHETDDIVEKIGVRKAMEAAESADLILFLLDTSQPIQQEDREIAEFVREKIKQGKRAIVLLNKSDLDRKTTLDDAKSLFFDENSGTLKNSSFITCSILEKKGLDELSEKISDMFHAGELLQQNEVMLTNTRHKEQVQAARDAIALVIQSIDHGMSEDFFSIDLMTAYTSLGNVIGESVEDDLVEEIFSRFCLGK